MKLSKIFSGILVTGIFTVGVVYGGGDVRSENFELKPNQQFNHELPIAEPSIFSIENSMGDIRVVATPGNVIRLRGEYRGGSKPATLKFKEVEKGKIKVFIEYPGGTGGTSINMGGGGVVISGGGSVVVSSISGRNVSIINGKVIIDGVEVSGNSGGVSIGGSGSAALTLEVPSEFLLHLKAESKQGNVEAIGFEAGDNNRQITLETSQGNVSAERVNASGGIRLDTKQGDAEAAQATGRLEMYSKQGNISASGNIGDIKAETKMGNIHIVGQKGHVDAETKMGNINLNNPESLSETATSKMGNVRGLKSRGCADPLRDIGKKGPFNF